MYFDEAFSCFEASVVGVGGGDNILTCFNFQLQYKDAG
jgi:hypothetical protein